MSFLIIPALDLKDGKCVQLVQGDPSRKIIELGNPADIALSWEKLGAERLHLVDLDGAIGGKRKNQKLVEQIIAKLEIPVQFGGGIRDIDDARFFLDIGAEKVIIGTLAVREQDTIKKLAEKYGRERVIIALDSKDGMVVTKGWREKTDMRASEIVKNYEKCASEILFTNVNVEGLMKGIDEKAIEEVVSATSLGVIVAGGIATLEDIKRVKKLGAFGAVIGSALYTGKINLEEALKIR